MSFPDRSAAGRDLGRALSQLVRGRDTVVLGLAMGGVPVGAEVAEALDAPLDVFVVRKLVAGTQGIAVGALASGGIQVFDDAALERLGLSDAAVAAVTAHELQELRRYEGMLRADRADPRVRGAHVVLVDDVLSTGVTMAAAVAAVRRLGATHVIVAVPAGCAGAVDVLERIADRVVCLDRLPGPTCELKAVYRDARTPSEDEVLALLSAHRSVV